MHFWYIKNKYLRHYHPNKQLFKNVTVKARYNAVPLRTKLLSVWNDKGISNMLVVPCSTSHDAPRIVMFNHCGTRPPDNIWVDVFMCALHCIKYYSTVQSWTLACNNDGSVRVFIYIRFMACCSTCMMGMVDFLQSLCTLSSRVCVGLHSITHTSRHTNTLHRSV